MKRRVLLVVSAFNPAIVADMQRARMLAWELPKLDWDVEVLAPKASEVRQDVVERDAAAFFPPDLPVYEVGSVGRRLLEALGSHTHTWRTILPLWQRGAELISSKQFDLVYFTTAAFAYFALGPYWKRKYGVPYVTDFHDPWIKEPNAADALKGRLPRLANSLSVYAERSAVTNADGIVAVSPKYIEMLQARYGAYDPAWLRDGRRAVIPFGALESDLTEAAKTATCIRRRKPEDLVICYVGVGGSIMVRSFALICRALALLRSRRGDFVN